MKFLCQPDVLNAQASLFTTGPAAPMLPCFLEVLPIACAIVCAAPPSNTAGLFWTPMSLSGYNFIVGIGQGFVLPVAGTFTLTFGANTTTAIPYNAQASVVASALNALASITTAGGVTVTAAPAPAGYYYVTFNSNGTQVAITGNGSELEPTGAVIVGTLIPGDSGDPCIQTVTITQSPAASCTCSTASASPTITVVENTAGGSGNNAVYTVTLTPAPPDTYDGQFSLTVGGQTTAFVPYNVAPSNSQNGSITLQSALQALSCVGAGNVTVTQTAGGIYVLIFGGGTVLPATTTNTSAVISMTNTTGLALGMTASGTGIAVTGTPTTTSITGLSTLILSANATSSNSQESIIVGGATLLGNTTSGSPTITVTSTAGIMAGEVVTGTGIPVPCTVSSIPVTLSAACTASGTVNATFGGKGNTDMGTITANASLLQAIPYLSGNLDLRVAGVQQLLNGAQSVATNLEIVAIPASGLPLKVYRQPVTLQNSVNFGTTSSPPVPPGSFPVYFQSLTGYVGGPGYLDGLSTVNALIPSLAIFARPTGGIGFYQLVSGTEATDSTAWTYVRPTDYNASTNQKVWQSIG